MSPYFLILMASAAFAADLSWPQFRGPAGRGAVDSDRPPVEFGLTKNLLWKTPVPSGHSSPSIWGGRIFLSAFDQETRKLEVLSLDRKRQDSLAADDSG
jgi:outer membrane protein assembly factor BamB